MARLGSDLHSLTAFGTGGAATWAGSGSPRLRAGGAPGRRECFPALGATGASCTGCGATARVDEGVQRAEEGGGGKSASKPKGFGPRDSPPCPRHYYWMHKSRFSQCRSSTSCFKGDSSTNLERVGSTGCFKISVIRS